MLTILSRLLFLPPTYSLITVSSIYLLLLYFPLGLFFAFPNRIDFIHSVRHEYFLLVPSSILGFLISGLLAYNLCHRFFHLSPSSRSYPSEYCLNKRSPTRGLLLLAIVFVITFLLKLILHSQVDQSSRSFIGVFFSQPLQLYYLLIFLQLGKPPKSWQIFLMLTIPISLAMLGSRYQAVSFLSSVVLIYILPRAHYFRLTFRHILLFIFFFFSLFLIKLVAIDLAQGSSNIINQPLPSILFSSLFAPIVRINNSQILSSLLWHSKYFAFTIPSSFADAISSFLSYSLPSYSGNQLGQSLLVIDPSNTVTGIAPTILGEFFIRYGVLVSVILFCSLGFTYGVIDAACINSNSSFRYFLYAILYPVLIYSFENITIGLLSSIARILLLGIFIFAIYRFFSAKRLS